MDVDSIHSEELQAVPNIETVTTNLDNAPEWCPSAVSGDMVAVSMRLPFL